jgi:hypothetical protein
MMSAVKVPHTFEMRPTLPGLPKGQRPDELMIDWRSLPEGSIGSIYAPAVDATASVAQAVVLYGSTTLTATDAHTLTCPAQDVTYLPIPVSADSSLAGLLVVEPPSTIRGGQQFTVDIYQLRSMTADGERGRYDTNAVARAEAVAPPPQTAMPSSWRRVLGTFHVMIPVVARRSILEVEERQLSVLRWILAGVAPADRNYLTFRRYVDLYAQRVTELGGNPEHVPASPTGTWPGGPGQRSCPQGDDDWRHEHSELWGKVEAAVFDHFGDFEGFVLETERGDRITFYSREDHIRDLALHAMAARIRTSVVSEHRGSRRVRRILLHQTPGLDNDRWW